MKDLGDRGQPEASVSPDQHLPIHGGRRAALSGEQLDGGWVQGQLSGAPVTHDCFPRVVKRRERLIPRVKGDTKRNPMQFFRAISNVWGWVTLLSPKLCSEGKSRSAYLRDHPARQCSPACCDGHNAGPLNPTLALHKKGTHRSSSQKPVTQAGATDGRVLSRLPATLVAAGRGGRALGLIAALGLGRLLGYTPSEALPDPAHRVADLSRQVLYLVGFGPGHGEGE